MGDELREATEAVWAAFGDRPVSRQVAVCTCPACMSEADRARLIATTARALPAELIRRHHESAHAAPDRPGDLRALLPRYLELLAQGEEVDGNGLGTDLRRFGAAWRADPSLVGAAEREALDGWLRQMARAVCRGAEAGRVGARIAPAYLIDMAIRGPWPAATVIAATEAALEDPATGPAGTARFAWSMVRPWTGRLDLHLAGWDMPTARAAVARWLNAPRMAERLIGAGMAVGDPFDVESLDALLNLCGRIPPDLGPVELAADGSPAPPAAG